MKTDCLISFLLVIIHFIFGCVDALRSAAPFHHSCISELWSGPTGESDVQISASHAVHDANTYAYIWHDYFAHLTGFRRVFFSRSFRYHTVCITFQWLGAHFDISIARSRLHFELALVLTHVMIYQWFIAGIKYSWLSLSVCVGSVTCS